MVNKLIGLGLLLVVILGSCAVSAAVMRPTVDTAVTQIIENEYEQQPLEDAILVYTTIRGGNSRGWMAFAGFLVVCVGVGAYLVFLRLKPEYLKRQVSLLREMRRGNKPEQGQGPRSWVVPQSPTLPRVEDAPMLTDGTEDRRNTWVN